MKRWQGFVYVTGIIGGLAFATWGADQKPDAKASDYLEKLQLKLEHSAQRANQPGSSGSSVIGLRGTKQEPVSKQLYWKGKKGNEPVNLEEVKALRSAVELARAGQKTEAIDSLKKFEAKYPKSPLLADAR